LIFLDVSHECGRETKSLTTRAKTEVCGRGVLRKTFGFKEEEEIGNWGKLHFDELRVLYSSL